MSDEERAKKAATLIREHAKIDTNQLIERIEHGLALLKSGQLDMAQQKKVLVTVSALTREHAKQLGESLNKLRLEYETQ